MAARGCPGDESAGDWGTLDALSNVLQQSIALHRNGAARVTMTELSLYRLLAASPGDSLEIAVTKAPGIVALDKTEGSKKEYEDTGSDPPHGPGLASGPVPADSSTSICCGNCRRQGHSVRDCIGPVNEAGEIDGCPKCNTAGLHLYDGCPLRRASEDLDFVYRYRQRKPPLRSAMTWASFLAAADHATAPERRRRRRTGRASSRGRAASPGRSSTPPPPAGRPPTGSITGTRTQGGPRWRRRDARQTPTPSSWYCEGRGGGCARLAGGDTGAPEPPFPSRT